MAKPLAMTPPKFARPLVWAPFALATKGRSGR